MRGPYAVRSAARAQAVKTLLAEQGQELQALRDAKGLGGGHAAQGQGQPGQASGGLGAGFGSVLSTASRAGLGGNLGKFLGGN